MTQATFKRNAHASYFTRCLRAMPSQAQEQDSNRVTLAFFCLSGLALIGKLDPSAEDRDAWIEWLWTLQAPGGGFRGSTGEPASAPGNLPSTYTALACLALLRAPLDRLDRKALRSFLAACQAEDGSFSPTPDTQGLFQNDMRMAYTASLAAKVAGGGPAFDEPAAIDFVMRCQTWEGGYSGRPGIESHGGTNYCALAALSLLGALDKADVAGSSRWLVQRQIGGFQGRPGKLEDVCYSFWCGGALATIGLASLVNEEPNTEFLLDSQSPIGGFGKEPEEFPDPFHSYLALSALSLTGAREKLELAEIDPVYNMPPWARDWLLAEA
ncbi:geranylgeranyl transferase type-1 subunit beta [Vanrija albida]|uniref:Geranylgeranyl transferase type-1 subunit beta n=1 Tax=Vanrija albida TaxID=181172 RepID=A0ABR3Q215_9TREE